jgi:hypothetical protein
LKTLLAALALTLSLSAFADSVSFTYSGLESEGRVYYACDYAEAQTEKFLTVFGATNVDVRCFGGIEFGRMEPVSISATFDQPMLDGVIEQVTVKGDRWNPACGLNVAIIKNLLPKFGNVTVVSKNDSCSTMRSNYSYDFSIVR